MDLRKLCYDVSQGQGMRIMKQTDQEHRQHRNMYTIKGETDHQPRLDA